MCGWGWAVADVDVLAGGGGPGELAVAVVGEVPAGGVVFEVVVVLAQGGHVADAGRAVGVAQGVVEFAAA